MKTYLYRAIATMIAIAAVTSVAQGADLGAAPVYAPAYKAPMPVPAYNWTGLYIGVNGGYGWGQQDPFNIFTNRFDSFSVSYSGGLVGGTAGAQIQSGHVLLGIEADIDWANITGSSTVTPSVFGIPVPGLSASLTTKINDMSTARIRVGYAQDNLLFYATGGLALLDANTTVSTVNGFACTVAVLGAICAGTSHRIGATAGAGLEYGITPNMSAKLEYLYVAAASLELSHINAVRAGLNFRFGGN